MEKHEVRIKITLILGPFEISRVCGGSPSEEESIKRHERDLKNAKGYEIAQFDKIHKWLNEHNITYVEDADLWGTTFIFDNVEDAVAFKLKWL